MWRLVENVPQPRPESEYPAPPLSHTLPTVLNYIWAGLIVFSLLFAVGYDVRDLSQDTYRNGQELPARLVFPDGYNPAAKRQAAELQLDPATYGQFYGTEARPAATYPAQLISTADGLQLRLEEGAALPEPLATVRDFTNPRDQQLQGRVAGLEPGAVAAGAAGAEIGFAYEPVRFVKLNAISQAALDFAETAAEIALGLIGTFALFLGLLKIAEEAGVIFALARVVEPLLRPLFPEIPKGHPAFSMIVLNLSANVFGLGNAATPFGIKAMEELQTLNPEPETATNPMVMLLAMNTASVQLVPPLLLLALMGLQINELIFAIIATTTLSLVVAIAGTKLYGRLPSNVASDPNRLPMPPSAPPPADAPGGPPPVGPALPPSTTENA